MSFDQYDRIPFADLLEKISTGVVDGQLALEKNAIETENLLLNTELEENTVIVAVVETVDPEGNIVKVETLLNEKPISLYDLGLTPVSLQFADVEVELELVVLSHQKESDQNTHIGYTQPCEQSLFYSQKDYDHKNRLLLFWDTVKNMGNSPRYFRNEKFNSPSRLTVSSATSSAMRSKISDETWRIKATIKPKNMS